MVFLWYFYGISMVFPLNESTETQRVNGSRTSTPFDPGRGEQRENEEKKLEKCQVSSW